MEVAMLSPEERFVARAGAEVLRRQWAAKYACAVKQLGQTHPAAVALAVEIQHAERAISKLGADTSGVRS
jgi:hypothetical protein